MSESSERPEKKPNHAFQWGARAVLLAVLVVAVLLYFKESNVQSDNNKSFAAVDERVETKDLWRKDVDALLQGSWKRKKINDLEDRFVWRGPLSVIFGEYSFHLYYESDGYVRGIDPNAG